MDAYKCNQCGYRWYSRMVNIKPRCCPKCKRYDWDEHMKAPPVKKVYVKKDKPVLSPPQVTDSNSEGQPGDHV